MQGRTQRRRAGGEICLDKALPEIREDVPVEVDRIRGETRDECVQQPALGAE